MITWVYVSLVSKANSFLYCDYTYKAVYLISQNQIIDTDDLAESTVISSAVFPREVVEGAVKNDAAALIFVHNHPLGNPEPSTNDKGLTRELLFVGRIMRIKVLDPIVIGDNCYYSFGGEGLIEEYENDFLNLMLRGTAGARKRPYYAWESAKKIAYRADLK